MVIRIRLTEEMKKKGYPGTLLYETKTRKPIAYDSDCQVALREAEEKGYSRDELTGLTILPPGRRYVFAAA